MLKKPSSTIAYYICGGLHMMKLYPKRDRFAAIVAEEDKNIKDQEVLLNPLVIVATYE